MRKHGLGPAGLRPAPRRRPCRGRRGRPRVGGGHAARSAQRIARRFPSACCDWAGQHRFVARPRLRAAGAVQRPSRALGACPWPGWASRSRRIACAGGSSATRGPSAGQLWWNARSRPGHVRHGGWTLAIFAGGDALIGTGAATTVVAGHRGRRSPVWLYFYNDVARRNPGRRDRSTRRCCSRRSSRCWRGPAIRRPRLVHAGPRGGLLDQRLRARRRARRYGALLRRAAGGDDADGVGGGARARSRAPRGLRPRGAGRSTAHGTAARRRRRRHDVDGPAACRLARLARPVAGRCAPLGALLLRVAAALTAAGERERCAVRWSCAATVRR